jgi:hypothetical protein
MAGTRDRGSHEEGHQTAEQIRSWRHASGWSGGEWFSASLWQKAHEAGRTAYNWAYDLAAVAELFFGWESRKATFESIIRAFLDDPTSAHFERTKIEMIVAGAGLPQKVMELKLTFEEMVDLCAIAELFGYPPVDLERFGFLWPLADPSVHDAVEGRGLEGGKLRALVVVTELPDRIVDLGVGIDRLFDMCAEVEKVGTAPAALQKYDFFWPLSIEGALDMIKAGRYEEALAGMKSLAVPPPKLGEDRSERTIDIGKSIALVVEQLLRHDEGLYLPGGTRCAQTQAGMAISLGILGTKESSHVPKPGTKGLS